MTLQVESWFSVPIWQASLNLDDFQINQLKQDCLTLEQTSEGRVYSNYGGWQSKDIFDEHQINLSVITSTVKKYVEECARQLGSNRSVSAANTWININRKGHFNAPHVHTKTSLVSVSYLTDADSSIVFKRQQDLFDYFLKEIGSENSTYFSYTSVSYKPQKNMVLIFPAWLTHETEPHNSDDPRISITTNFNIE